MSENADAIDIDERVTARQLLDDGNVIRQAVVAKVAVVVVVECLAAKRRAEVIDLHHDEPQLRDGRRLAGGFVIPRAHRANLRAGIDVRDDRIATRGVQIRRQVHHAVHIGHTIARLRGEHARTLEAERREL